MNAPEHVIMDTLKWALDQYISGDATAERTLVRVTSVVYGEQSPTPAVPSGAGEPRGAGDEYLGVDEKRGAQKGVRP